MRRLMLVAAVAAIVGAFVAAPVAVVASHQFTDVPDGHTFHADIDWMADNGITFGCGSGKYCPQDEVTRGQMAAFMKRLATNQVVDADKVDGMHASDFAAAADSRFISLSPYEAFVEDATLNSGFGRHSGIDLPNAGGPAVGWGFTLPPDFPTGGTVTVELLWHTNSTSCGIEFSPNSISVGRAGRIHIQGSGAATGLSVVGGDTLSAPATATQSQIVELAIVTPDGVTELAAGDSVILSMFRDVDAGADTCIGDLTIQAGSVRY